MNPEVAKTPPIGTPACGYLVATMWLPCGYHVGGPLGVHILDTLTLPSRQLSLAVHLPLVCLMTPATPRQWADFLSGNLPIVVPVQGLQRDARRIHLRRRRTCRIRERPCRLGWLLVAE